MSSFAPGTDPRYIQQTNQSLQGGMQAPQELRAQVQRVQQAPQGGMQQGGFMQAPQELRAQVQRIEQAPQGGMQQGGFMQPFGSSLPQNDIRNSLGLSNLTTEQQTNINNRPVPNYWSQGYSAQPQSLLTASNTGTGMLTQPSSGGVSNFLGSVGSGIQTGLGVASDFLSDYGDLFAGGAGLAAVNAAYNKLGTIGERAQTGAANIAQQGLEQSQFRPYTVTSGLGNTQATDTGLNVNLSPEQQALQAQLGQGAQGFFDQAMQGTAQREQDVYNQLRAMQSPEEERQRLELEERLQNQGRLGVRTSMFGGTPEQFALDKAQAEARNTSAVSAMEQAQLQQKQQADIGTQFMKNQYMPQAALMDQFGSGLQNANLAQAAQLYGAGLFGEANMGGLEAYLGSGLGQANLIGNVGSGLLAGLFGGGNSSSAFSDWFNN